MARIKSLFLLVVALICVHLCSANQNTPNNNQDPCRDPTSPQYNQVLPWRELVLINTQVTVPRAGTVDLTDTTGCVLLRIYYGYFQSNTELSLSFPAIMRGDWYDLCGGHTYAIDAIQDKAQLNIPSLDVQSATLEPLAMTGHYFDYSNGSTGAFTITTERAYFYATTEPFSETQQDDYLIANDSPCKTRLRFDAAANVVYSQPFQLTATLGNGQVYSFTFPADAAATAYYNRDKYFYQQCSCATAASSARVRQTRADPTASTSNNPSA